jgi:Ca-activated chloride channel family protein
MRYRYGRFTGDPLDEIDLEQLLARLSDFLLTSGFQDPYHAGETEDQTIQALHDAITEALMSGDLLPQDLVDQLAGDVSGSNESDPRSALDRLIDQIIKRLTHEGYIAAGPDLEAARMDRRGGPGSLHQRDLPPVRFEITDKGLDFLGYRTLRDLMGSLGRSSLGRHQTRDVAPGIEAGAAPKPYEFGDTLNLDATATLLNAARRQAAGPPHSGAVGAGWALEVEAHDLMVAQCDYHSSCATVLMLDCSHSMILYGEDRFTPAKRVALALANLVRHQYPGDELRVVLFHDSAEEIPIGQLARVRVGPYYTNTREGLRLARRLLDRSRKEMRQIVMITDGKPSALTRPDGRIYRNAFGLDPFIVSETFAEVSACRKGGVMINTFMLARDHELVAFVRRVAQICRGKAYFTTPYTLGRYVLMDYLNRKTRTVH